MMKQQRILTGITTTGTPHLGNYLGAIRPAILASRKAGVASYYFLADYHALIKCDDPSRIQRSTLEIAATWLAAGLDPNQVTFYRQSDIPEIPELNWLLTCVTGKGMLNRAHAYKAMLDRNEALGADMDADVSAGLFMYPVLMSADILIFNAHKVPVGRDQIQHIEMARDIAQRFNHLYGEYFTLPEVQIEENVATLPGLDGRKMSKSYDNTIPLFASYEELKKCIAAIKTDSKAPGEPKEIEGSSIFQLYQAFSSPAETEQFKAAYAAGIAWGDAKNQLLERINQEVAPMRERYNALIQQPAELETILQMGAEKARTHTRVFIKELRHAVGLRNLSEKVVAEVKVKADKNNRPSFKQYRESDGLFYFKLVDAQGKLLLQSSGFTSPKDAAQSIQMLQKNGASALQTLAQPLTLGPAIEIPDLVAICNNLNPT